jgi:hypothetical protein
MTADYSFLDEFDTDTPKKKSSDKYAFLDELATDYSFLDELNQPTEKKSNDNIKGKKPTAKEKVRDFFKAPAEAPESIAKDYQELYPNIAQNVKDYFSSLAEPIKPEEQTEIAGVKFNPVLKTLYQNIANGKFGEDIVKQMQSGGFAGAPAATKEIAKKTATDLAVIGAVEAAFVPILGAAAASTVAPRILTSFAHLTQAATTGAGLTVANSLVENGELPTLDEVVENGLEWVAIDAAMQALTHGGSAAHEFTQAIRKIAKEDNIPVSKVLGNLWDASKNWIKRTFGRAVKPDEILPEDALVLYNQAKETELDITPKKKPPEKPKIPYEEPLKIEHKEQVVPVKPDEEIKTEAPAKEKKPTAKAKPAPVEPKPEAAPKKKLEKPIAKDKGPLVSYKGTVFKTSRGSTYEIGENGSTTRYKAYRPEHGFDQGPKTPSEKTFFIDKDQMNKLDVFATKGDGSKKIFTYPDGKIGVMYTSGPNKGKVIERSIVQPHPTPKLDLYPLEIWENGEVAHFGNKIIDINVVEAADKKTTFKKLIDLIPDISSETIKERIKFYKKGLQKGDVHTVEYINALELELHNRKLGKISKLDVTPAGLQKQKEYILDKVDDALAHPPTSEKIHIDVPGDGEFNIINTPKALETFRNRIEKKWPTKALPSLQKTYKKPNARKTDRVSTIEKQNAKILDEFNRVKAEYDIEWHKDKRNQSKVDELHSKMVKLNEKYMANNEKIEKIAKIKESDVLSSKKATAPTAKKKGVRFPRPAASRHLPPQIGKEQAVSRSKIIQLFRDAFQDPIRIGKMGRRARTSAGFHKLWPRVTRLLKDNDVETAAHEIGHNLHGVLYGGKATNLTQMNANVHAALKPYLNELKPLSGYEPYDMEGFAEFTRMYVTNPTAAKQQAPNFYAKFEADLDAMQPKLKNALLEARDYYSKWLNATPESRISAHKVSGQQTFMERVWDKATNSFDLDKFLTNFSDDLFHAKRLVSEAFDIPLNQVENFKHEDNVYRAARLLKSAVNKGEVFLTYETFDPITLEKTGESLKAILDELKIPEELEEFENYLIAKRAIEKHGQGIKTGIVHSDAVYYVKKYEPTYFDLAQRFYAYCNHLLDYAQKCQLLSLQSLNRIREKNMFYAPFLRHKGKQKGFASGSGRMQAKQPIKRMKGGEGDIISPFESIIKLTYEITTNSEKNLVALMLARVATQKGAGRLVEHVPVPMKLKGKVLGGQVATELAKTFETNGLQDLIEYDANGKLELRQDILDAMPEVFLSFGPGKYRAGENIITYFQDGKPRYLEVTPELYEMWTKGTSPYEANLIIKLMSIPVKTLRAGAILNPKFMMKNIVRDTWGSYIFTRYPKNFVNPINAFIETLYEPLAGLAHAAKKDALYVLFLKSGGGMSSLVSLDLHSVALKMEDLRDGKGMKSLLHMLRVMGELSEEANRLAEFARALQVEEDTRLGKEISAFAARDLSIDYAKIGLLVKSLNQVSAFTNATIQGGTKLFRTMSNPKTRQDFIIRCLQMIVLPSLVLAWYNKDDKRIEEIPRKERDFNLCFFVGNTLVKIPVPFEPGVISNGLTQRMYEYMIKHDPDAFEGFFGSVAEAMLPNFIATLEIPLIETYANKSFFTGGRIIPADKERLISRLQYNRFTSHTARLIGRAVSYMVGPDTTSKAASPAVIDHFIKSYTGGLGSLVVNIADEALEKLGLVVPGEKTDRTIIEKLGLDAFTSRYPRASSKSIEEFYDLYGDFKARATSIKYEQKVGGDESEHAALMERTDNLYDAKSLDKAYRAIQRCQKAINSIHRNPEITAEEKQQLTDQLYLDMTAFARAAVENIKEHRKNK